MPYQFKSIIEHSSECIVISLIKVLLSSKMSACICAVNKLLINTDGLVVIGFSH